MRSPLVAAPASRICERGLRTALLAAVRGAAEAVSSAAAESSAGAGIRPWAEAVPRGRVVRRTQVIEGSNGTFLTEAGSVTVAVSWAASSPSSPRAAMPSAVVASSVFTPVTGGGLARIGRPLGPRSRAVVSVFAMVVVTLAVVLVVVLAVVLAVVLVVVVVVVFHVVSSRHRRGLRWLRQAFG